jgi:GT2 family glycosyltransferase
LVDQADEIVLVDNGSLGAEVSSIGSSLGIRVLRLQMNRGFSGGVNAGLKVAAGDIVGLLNDDAIAEAGWIKAGTRVLSDPAVAAVAPKLLLNDQFAEIRLPDEAHFAPGDGRSLGRQLFTVTVGESDVLGRLAGGVHGVEQATLDGRHIRWRWTSGPEAVYVPLPPGIADPEILVNGEQAAASWVGDLVNNAGSYLSVDGYGGDYGFETPDDGRFSQPAERFAATGAAMIARAETFRRLGGMAPQFFAYYEDTDWCWRARLAGLTVRYDPEGVVRHVRSVTSGGAWVPLVRLLAARNRILCLARNAPLRFFGRQLSADWRGEPVPGLRRSLARHVPHQLVQRRRLARHWVLDPGEVIARWAGADERWDTPSPEP